MLIESNLITAGRLAMMFKLPPSHIARVLERSGVAPGLTLNELPYFPEEAAVNAIRSQEERKEPKRGVNE
jgi:hypothetical protein